MLQSLGSIAISSFWVFLYVVAAVQAGQLALRVMKLDVRVPGPAIATINLSFLVGLAFLHVVLLVLGLVGLLNAAFVLSSLLGSAILGAWRLFAARGMIGTVLRRGQNEAWKALPVEWRLISIVLILAIGTLGILSLWLPVSGDAEAFYMTLPKVIAHAERLVPLRNYGTFSSIGLFGEIHFAALMSISGVMSAKLLVWVMYVSLLVSMWSLCSLSGHSLRGKLICQALLLTSSAVVLTVAGGKIDLFSAAYGLALFSMVLDREKTWNVRECLLAGIFLGVSVVSKLSYIPVMYPGIAVALLLAGKGTSRFKNALVRFVLIASVSFAAFIPQFAKNYVFFREPFAPFLYLSAPPSGSLLRQVWYSAEATRYIVLGYPLHLFFGRFPMQGGTLSPLIPAFLLLGLFGLFGKRKSAPLELHALTVAFVCTAVWVILRPSVLAPRYILAPILLLVPVAGGFCERFLLQGSRRMASLGLALSLLGALVLSGSETGYTRSVRRVASAVVGGRELANRNSGAIDFLNKIVPEGQRVFVAGYYTFYMRPDILECLNSDEDNDRTSAIKSVDELATYLQERGFRYVYEEKTVQWGEFSSVGKSPFHLLYEDDRCRVLSLEQPVGWQARFETRKVGDKYWIVVQADD